MTSKIKTWTDFHKKVRLQQTELFTKLNDFPKAVFIAGCQRSGTTILSRIIRESEGFNDFPSNIDDELYAALLLSGKEQTIENGNRFCFQTTYLNENYKEYSKLRSDQRLIWIVREPQSVIFSMVYRWRSFSLNELFAGCGFSEVHLLPQRYKILKYGYHFFPKLLKACYAYIGKSKQIFEIKALLKEKVLIIEYEELIKNKTVVLQNVFTFINGKITEDRGAKLVSKSLNKKKALSKKEKSIIKDLCDDTYQSIRNLIT